jgi:hypothetical protein
MGQIDNELSDWAVRSAILLSRSQGSSLFHSSRPPSLESCGMPRCSMANDAAVEP